MRIRLRDNVQTAIEMAMIDPLTGLNNRRYLESHLATLLDQAAHRGRPLSLMILDIDHFKAVNDTRGHNRVTAVAALARRTWEIHHASLGKQRVDPANALISLQFSGRPVTLPWPDGFASGGGEEVPTSGTPAVVRV
jgi:hypothetical protein